MKKKSKMISEMNVVPYIDVMFVLLIIFMISTPMITYGIKVDLPKTTEAKQIKPEKNNPPIILTIKKDGKMYFLNENEEDEMSIKEVLLYIKSHQRLNNKRKVFIRADENLKYKKIIEVMNVLKNNRIEEVGLITKNQKK